MKRFYLFYPNLSSFKPVRQNTLNMELSQEELKIKIDFLIIHIDERITGFTKRRNDNKHKAQNFHVLVTFLGTLGTVVLGLDFVKYDCLSFLQDNTKNIALIISAGVTVVSAYNMFFDHKGLWVNYTTTRNDLYALKFDIDFYLQGNKELEINTVIQFKDRYNDILDRANQKWSKIRE